MGRGIPHCGFWPHSRNQHVLHRAPDATGLVYWSNATANGMSASEMLVSFSESQENLSNSEAVLSTGLWLT